MSVRALFELMNATPTWRSPQEFAVLCAVANFQNDKYGGWAWPTHAKIAALVRLSERQTERILEDLAACGLLLVQERAAGRNRSKNRYQLKLNGFSTPDTGDGYERARQDFTPDTCDFTPDTGVGCTPDTGDGSHPTSGDSHGAVSRTNSCDLPAQLVRSTEIEQGERTLTERTLTERGAASPPNTAPPSNANSQTQNKQGTNRDFVDAREIAEQMVLDRRRVSSLELLVSFVIEALVDEHGDASVTLDHEAIETACLLAWTKSRVCGRRMDQGNRQIA